MAGAAQGQDARSGRAARRAVAAALAACAAGAAAPEAEAGTYTVDICRDWTTEAARGVPSGSMYNYFSNLVTSGCASGGPVRGQLADPALPAGDSARFGWAIPDSIPNLRVRRIQARYSSGAPSGNAATMHLLGDGVVLESSAAPGITDADETPSTGVREVLWRISCSATGAAGSCTFPTVTDALALDKARLTLEDAVAPGGAIVAGGSVTSAGPQRGTRDLRVDATDTDSGVRRVTVRLGGQVAGEVLAAPAAATWAPYPRTRTGLAVPVDTAVVADGTWPLTLELEDAGANVTTIAGPDVLVDNVPAPTATRPPALSGGAAQGQTLVLDTGDWDGHGRSVVLEPRWQRSADGDTWVDVTPSAQDATRYVLGAADVGRRVRAVVRATSTEGTQEAAAGTTAPVAAAPAAQDGSAAAPGSGAGGAGGGGAGGGGGLTGPPAPAADGSLAGPVPGAPGATTAAARMTVSVLGRGRRARVRYGRRAPVAGALTDQLGRPVPGARVDVLERRDRSGVERHVATLVTDASGRFSYVPALGPSRILRFAHRARPGDLAYSVVGEIDLRVVAALSLRVDRHRLRNGRAVTFRGALRGARGRKVIELQVRRGRGWLTFATVVSHDGRFRHRYRFTRTWWTTRYTFRARVRAQDGFAYETGSSAPARVLVRGTGLPRE